MALNWIWGEKKQKPTKVNFTSETREVNKIKRTAHITLEIQFEYPEDLDIVDVVRQMHAKYSCAPRTQVLDVNMLRVEFR